ncbi:hypothetical protein ACFX1X_029849 [Malus domestica]
MLHCRNIIGLVSLNFYNSSILSHIASFFSFCFPPGVYTSAFVSVSFSAVQYSCRIVDVLVHELYCKNEVDISTSSFLHADIAFGHVGGQRNPLVFADEVAHFVNLLVAHLAQRRLVNATEDVRLHRLANVALKSPSDTPTPASPSPSASSYDGRITRMSSERFISCTTSPRTPTSSESTASTRTPLPSIWSWSYVVNGYDELIPRILGSPQKGFGEDPGPKERERT